MYHRVDRHPGTVRVEESFKDEMTEAILYGGLGLLALNYIGANITSFMESTGIVRGLLIGTAFGSVFMLSTAFSSGIGRLARGLGRGNVIEIDLRGGRHRRYQRSWFFWKTGGMWQNLSEPVQGARVVWKGPRTQTALRLGQGRTFVFITEPGQVAEEVDAGLVAAVNGELAAQGVTSPEATAAPEQRPLTLRARWRNAWEYLSFAYLLFIFGAFMYSLFVVTVVLDQM